MPRDSGLSGVAEQLGDRCEIAGAIGIEHPFRPIHIVLVELVEEDAERVAGFDISVE